MKCNEAIKLLIKIDNEDSSGSNILVHLENNTKLAAALLNINVPEIKNLPTVVELTGNFYSSIQCSNEVWNYICLAFHILLNELKQIDISDENDLLTVPEQQNIKTLLEIVLMFGLVPNLIPGVGVSINSRTRFASRFPCENIPIIDKYIRLRFCTTALLNCAKNSNLRKFIVTRHLNDLLAALFQLCFAPLKKPATNSSPSTSNEFQISEQLWQELQHDRVTFKNALNSLISSTYQPLLIKEIMILMGVNKPLAPKWLKCESSKILCSMLMKKDGILALIRAMFDSDNVDIGAEWKNLQIVQKLVFDIGNTNSYPNFYQYLCSQILKMLDSELVEDSSKNLYLILSRLFMKSLLESRKYIFQREIFDKVVEPLVKCTKNVQENKLIVVEEKELSKCLKYVYRIFALDINSNTEIAILSLLLPYFDVFYQMHVKFCSLSLKNQKYTSAILIKLLNNAYSSQLAPIYNLLIYRKTSDILLKFNESLEIKDALPDGVSVHKSEIKINYIVTQNDDRYLSDIIDQLSIRAQSHLFKIIFSEFCNVFATKPDLEQFELLKLESNAESLITLLAGEKLVTLNILARLAEKKSVMERLDVKVLIVFLIKLFNKYENMNTDDFQNAQGLFLSLMLLDLLLNNNENCANFERAVNPLQVIAKKTNNLELQDFIESVCIKIRSKSNVTHAQSQEKSAYRKALDEICDPLLPVRGHGLMTLTKLIESKDKEACARKQYILCIFQENLKNADSYIYLTAINGVASLATVYTESVIETLTEEYVNVKQWEDEEEHQRVRISLGEVLVKVTKNLGEMAPKYKTILLNAFLFGTKDYDNLIRASSLSNLGQVCEVLGYKLGNATTEILQCLNAIIETDKAVEARRAAVMVIYQLLKGLGPDTIVFLKEALLPIYRKLKEIYLEDSDDVMKLHAQLALEELNSSTRNFLLPPVPIEKTINIFS